MIGIILYLLYNSYNTFSIGIPLDYNTISKMRQDKIDTLNKNIKDLENMIREFDNMDVNTFNPYYIGRFQTTIIDRRPEFNRRLNRLNSMLEEIINIEIPEPPLVVTDEYDMNLLDILFQLVNHYIEQQELYCATYPRSLRF